MMNPFMNQTKLPERKDGFFGTLEYTYQHPQRWGLVKGIVAFGIGVVLARTISQEFANPMP